MKKKTLWIVIAAVCIVICIASAAFLIQYALGLSRSRKLVASVRTSPISIPVSQTAQEAPQTDAPVELNPTIQQEPGAEEPEEPEEPDGPETVETDIAYLSK